MDAGAAGGGRGALPKLSLVTALREQLGLKLEPRRGVADVLVVEEVERPAAD